MTIIKYIRFQFSTFFSSFYLFLFLFRILFFLWSVGCWLYPLFSVLFEGFYFFFLIESGLGPFITFFFKYFSSIPWLAAILNSFLLCLSFYIVYCWSWNYYSFYLSSLVGINFSLWAYWVFLKACLSISSIVILWSGPKYMMPIFLCLSFLLKILSCVQTTKLCYFLAWSRMHWSTGKNVCGHLLCCIYFAFCAIIMKSCPSISNYWSVQWVTLTLSLPCTIGLSLSSKSMPFSMSILRKLPSIIKL